MDELALHELRAKANRDDADSILELACALARGGVRAGSYVLPEASRVGMRPRTPEEEAFLDFELGFRKLSASVSSSSKRDAARADASYLHARHGMYRSLTRLLEKAAPREDHARDAVWRDRALAHLADGNPSESLRVLRSLLFYRPSDLVLLLLATKSSLLKFRNDPSDENAAEEAWQLASSARRQAREAPASKSLVPLAAQAEILYASILELCFAAGCSGMSERPETRLAEACTAYSLAADMEGPWQTKAWCGLARCALAMQNLAEAETAAKRALQSSGGACEAAWVLLAVIADAKRKPHEAMDVLRAAAKVFVEPSTLMGFPSQRGSQRGSSQDCGGRDVQLSIVRLEMEDAIDAKDSDGLEASYRMFERLAMDSETSKEAACLLEELAYGMGRAGNKKLASKAARLCAEQAGVECMEVALRAEASAAVARNDPREAERLLRTALAMDPTHARSASWVAEALLNSEESLLPKQSLLAMQILQEARYGPWMRDNARLEALIARARPYDEQTKTQLLHAARMEVCSPRLPLPPCMLEL